MMHLLSNNELLQQIHLESGKAGYANYLRRKLQYDQENVRKILLSELTYIRNRVKVRALLKQLFEEGKPLPKGCVQQTNGFCSIYYKSLTLDGRWDPSNAYNEDDEDSEAYETFINGLYEMNIHPSF